MELEAHLLCHKNNIAQKLRTATGANLVMAREVGARYEVFETKLTFPKDKGALPTAAVDLLNSYIDFVKDVEAQSPFFNWRSNFAGSVLPEFFYRYILWMLNQNGIPALFSTKDSVVEATFSGNSSGALIRRKDQDLCIGIRREKLLTSAGEQSFVVPAVSCEVKTNIDINKLNGLDFSAERLKRSFPSAKYFLITETIDFSLEDNYAAGYVDEVFVLRKQLRSKARRAKEPILADVVKAASEVMAEAVARAAVTSVHVYDRLPTGKLINFEAIKAAVK